jgi:hypothetical protein
MEKKMRHTPVKTFITAGLLTFATAISVPSFVAAQTNDTLQAGPVVQEQNGISYATGGVSDAEQAAFEEARSEYNLQLTMALDSGHYLSEIPVRVMDAQGNTVLDTTSAGPFLFAQLDPGSYTVEATYNGDTKQQKVDVGSSGSGDVMFRW